MLIAHRKDDHRCSKDTVSIYFLFGISSFKFESIFNRLWGKMLNYPLKLNLF